MLAALLNVLRGYRTGFDALELAILRELRVLLPEHVRPAFDDRLERINRVHPLLGGIELNFFESRRGEILFPESSRILAADEPIKLATVKLHAADEMSRLRGSIWCGGGVLTSIEFNRPSEHAELEHIDRIDVCLRPGLPWI